MATTIFLVNPQTFPIATSYLLDTYTAAAAYSLRQLKTGVTNVVRVRRSGDNAESDFTATDITDGSLASWVVAGGGTQDGYVSQWIDQSGNGNTVTQATAGNQPQLVSSGSVLTKGSLPAVQFDGSNDRLSKTPSFINLTSVSYFSVSASASTGTIGTIHSQGAETTNLSIRTFCDARATPNRNLAVSNSISATYYADLSTARVDTNQRLLSSFIDASSNMSAFDNGATGGTNTYAGTIVNNGLILGAQFTTTPTISLPLNGYIQEFIAFNSDESANRTAIESDINTHYSIY